MIEYPMKVLAATTARSMAAVVFCDGVIVDLHLYSVDMFERAYH